MTKLMTKLRIKDKNNNNLKTKERKTLFSLSNTNLLSTERVNASPSNNDDDEATSLPTPIE